MGTVNDLCQRVLNAQGAEEAVTIRNKREQERRSAERRLKLLCSFFPYVPQQLNPKRYGVRGE